MYSAARNDISFAAYKNKCDLYTFYKEIISIRVEIPDTYNHFWLKWTSVPSKDIFDECAFQMLQIFFFKNSPNEFQ